MENKEKSIFLKFYIVPPIPIIGSQLQIAIEKMVNDKDMLNKMDLKVISKNRSAEGSLLIATVPVAGAIIVALITALLKITQTVKAKQITFKRNKEEAVLIIPADTTTEKLNEYIKVLEKMGKLDIYIE